MQAAQEDYGVFVLPVCNVNPSAKPKYFKPTVNKLSPKICVILPSLIGYSETFLQAHVDNLATAVNYLQDFPIDIEDVFQQQRYSSRAERLVHTIRVCWHRYVLNPIKTRSVRHFLTKNKIEAVLAEYGMTAIGAANICKDLNIPLVVHFHGHDAYSSELLNRHRAAYKRIFDHASAIIAVSKHMVDQLVNLGAPREKVVYNPYGVELNNFAQARILTSPCRVLAVGRFVEKKAPYLTILAFKKVLDRFPDARLVMVGSGLLHDICCKLIKALRIEHAVELKGALDHDDIATLMQQSRVFVQHSLVPASGDREGTPVAILEAGAAGLPVVSTKHAGIIDVVIHGKTGFLVDEGDIDAMSDYICKVLANVQLANQMGQNAREYIRTNFDMRWSIENLRRVIEACTTNSRLLPEFNATKTADLNTVKQS